MKRGAIVLGLAVLLSVAGFLGVRWASLADIHGRPSGHDYAQHGPEAQHHELDWLKNEMGATHEQLEKIQALHVAYHPMCEHLTHRLEASHETLDKITASATSVTRDLEAALREHAEIHLECQQAMLKHFYETAACLQPEQARRYLDKMLPLVFFHDAAESVPHTH
jgi:Spy/CpxP family protein refolding chaperone